MIAREFWTIYAIFVLALAILVGAVIWFAQTEGRHDIVTSAPMIYEYDLEGTTPEGCKIYAQRTTGTRTKVAVCELPYGVSIR